MTARDIVSLELFADDQVRRIKAVPVRVPAVPPEPRRLRPNADRGPYARRVVDQPNAPWHGTLSGYSRHNCHCGPCQAAWGNNIHD